MRSFDVNFVKSFQSNLYFIASANFCIHFFQLLVFLSDWDYYLWVLLVAFTFTFGIFFAESRCMHVSLSSKFMSL